MDASKKDVKPSKYEIHVKNHLDTRWERWFEGMMIIHIQGGVTIMTGEVVDQSALHGLLEKIYALNLSLILVRRIDPDPYE